MNTQPLAASRWRFVPAGAAPWPIVAAFAVQAVVFLLQKDVSLNLEDEGFLWYGVQRVMAGEVPLRDFQAYDIGRYYWYAAWMWLTGSTGILPLRAGSAVLAGITVAIALTLVRKAGPRPASVTALALVTFTVWMVPYYKVADSFAALLLLAGSTRLLQDPSRRHCFQFGLCLGVAATIGINHGLYGVLGLALVLGWLLARRRHALPPRRLAAMAAALAGGVAVGYLPTIAFFIAVPGFAAGFVDSIRMLSEIGMTNLDRPLPSPFELWSGGGRMKFTAALLETVMGMALWAALAFLLFCAWHVLRRPGIADKPENATLVAAVLTTLPYAHYLWSRANLMHFAISVLPLLVAVFSLPLGRTANGNASPNVGTVRAVALVLVALVSGLLAGPAHPLYLWARPGAPLEPVLVAGERLRVTAYAAEQLRLLQQATEAYAAGGRAIYVVPYWPGAYAAMSRRAPTWEFYQIFPASPRRQQRELQRLVAADVGVALVLQHRADNRADLGFDQTHPLLARYLEQCLDRVEAPDAARMDVLVFVSRNQPCSTP